MPILRIDMYLQRFDPLPALRVVSRMVALLVAILWFGIQIGRCYAQVSDGKAGPSVAALLQQGVDQASRGQWAEADLSLEKAQKLAPNDVEVLTNLGKVKAKIQQVEAAIKLFRRVVIVEPRSAEAHLDLAVALADAHNLTEALNEILLAQQLAPALPGVHLNHARILADLHQTADAEIEFAKATKLEPSNPDCYFYWALLERGNGNLARETSLLETLVKLQPGNEEAWILLGDSFASQSKQQEAIVSWRRALSINPQSSSAVYKLSRALRTTHPAEAKQLEADFAALRKNSQSLDEIKTLGNAAYGAMQSQEWAEAIKKFRQAIDLCADCAVSGTLHKDLGLAYCDNGQLAEGRTELEIALRLSPRDPDIVRALAILSQPTVSP